MCAKLQEKQINSAKNRTEVVKLLDWFFEEHESRDPHKWASLWHIASVSRNSLTHFGFVTGLIIKHIHEFISVFGQQHDSLTMQIIQKDCIQSAFTGYCLLRLVPFTYSDMDKNPGSLIWMAGWVASATDLEDAAVPIMTLQRCHFLKCALYKEEQTHKVPFSLVGHFYFIAELFDLFQ